MLKRALRTSLRDARHAVTQEKMLQSLQESCLTLYVQDAAALQRFRLNPERDVTCSAVSVSQQ